MRPEREERCRVAEVQCSVATPDETREITERMPTAINVYRLQYSDRLSVICMV